MLPFAKQVELLLLKYPDCHTLTPSAHEDYCDISSGKMFPTIEPNTLYFIMNTDGFSPILSRKMQVWPLLLTVVNLPPSQRIKLSNVIMVAFHIGKSKPDWTIFLQHLMDAMKETVQFGGKKLSCKVVALVADAPAKSSCCNVQSTNAK